MSLHLLLVFLLVRPLLAQLSLMLMLLLRLQLELQIRNPSCICFSGVYSSRSFSWVLQYSCLSLRLLLCFAVRPSLSIAPSRSFTLLVLYSPARCRCLCLNMSIALSLSFSLSCEFFSLVLGCAQQCLLFGLALYPSLLVRPPSDSLASCIIGPCFSLYFT